MQKAKRLDPLNPAISSFSVGLYLALGGTQDAIRAGKRTLQIDPDDAYFDSALADAYRENGEFQRRSSFMRKRRPPPIFPVPD